MSAVDSNRLKVWQALSQFFLGTEVDQATYDQVAKSIGSLATVLKGKIDRIVLTGGMAYATYFTADIVDRVGFIAPVTIVPGEEELESLAAGARRVLRGEETARSYS